MNTFNYMETEANVQLSSCSTCSHEISLLLTQTYDIQCCHPFKVLLDASLIPCNPDNKLVLGDHVALYFPDQDKSLYTTSLGCYLAVIKV